MKTTPSQFLFVMALLSVSFTVWVMGAIYSARELGFDIEFSTSTAMAVLFFYATWFFGSVAAMLLCIGFAQPRKSAQNLAAISEAVRLAKEEALIAHDKETGSTKGEFNSAMREAQEKRKR